VFRKTLIKLTVINSLVFLCIFMMFGATLYLYVGHKLFDKIDDSMSRVARGFRMVDGRLAIYVQKSRAFDPRIIVFLRDREGNIINLFPNFSNPLISMEELKEAAEDVKLGTVQIVQRDTHSYRVMSIPYTDGPVGPGTYKTSPIFPTQSPILDERKIREVLAVSIVDSEVDMLQRLLGIIAVGIVIGMGMSLVAGYYLAQRALIPIRVAWDRQQQFVADASHELRTPLAVIKTNAELLLRHPEHSIEQESLRISNVVRESSRMSKLVSTLLTLARADSDQLELQFASVDLHEVVKEITEQFMPLAELKEVRLHVNLDPAIELVADRERLHQLVVILLDNALKYTSQDGIITLSCSKQANVVVIEVQDTGIGIPPEDLPRVFDRFYRSNKARSRTDDGGTGLGLAIAKWIVEKHGGKINVESTVGLGTRFYITIPVKKV
jgi:two-component system, OmpR family, sensor histidine kinase CiaH